MAALILQLLTYLFAENVGKFLRSDADAQLLLNIHFQQAVKIHSIKIDSPEDGRS